MGVAICAAAIVLMHVVQPTLNPVDVAVSYYLNGRLGAALGIGLVALGIGSLGLAAGLRATLDRSGANAGWWLLVVWGGGCIVGGIVPPDPYGQWTSRRLCQAWSMGRRDCWRSSRFRPPHGCSRGAVRPM